MSQTPQNYAADLVMQRNVVFQTVHSHCEEQRLKHEYYFNKHMRFRPYRCGTPRFHGLTDWYMTWYTFIATVWEVCHSIFGVKWPFKTMIKCLTKRRFSFSLMLCKGHAVICIHLNHMLFAMVSLLPINKNALIFSLTLQIFLLFQWWHLIWEGGWV